MKTRNGKIARLPLEIREQLNCRLADGEPGNRLVEWLNSIPDVMKVMAEQFEGRPITDNNLSEWRAGGYEEWLTLDAFLDETRVISENAGAVAETGISSDHLHIVLLAHHARLLKNLETMPENEFKTRLNTVSKLTASIMKMRRDELQKARLELQRERLEFLREKELVKSASSEAFGSGAGGALRQTQGLEWFDNAHQPESVDGQAKCVETAGGGPGRGRQFRQEPASQAVASTSAHARPVTAEETETASPPPARSCPDNRPGAKSSGNEETVPPIRALSPELAREIPIPFGRIQSELPDPGVELPALRDWLASVGLGPISALLPHLAGIPARDRQHPPQKTPNELAA